MRLTAHRRSWDCLTASGTMARALSSAHVPQRRQPELRVAGLRIDLEQAADSVLPEPLPRLGTSSRPARLQVMVRTVQATPLLPGALCRFGRFPDPSRSRYQPAASSLPSVENRTPRVVSSNTLGLRPNRVSSLGGPLLTGHLVYLPTFCLQYCPERLPCAQQCAAPRRLASWCLRQS